MKPILPLAAFIASASWTSAALVSQFGILDLSANGGINPNTGNAWQNGDQYRLAFYTSDGITATSNDPGVYDAFATAQAQSSGLGNGAITSSVGWTAMVWVNTDPLQNTDITVSSPLVRSGTGDLTGGSAIGGAGVPVFAMNGTTAIARNNADIYDNWSNPFDGDSNVRIPAGTGAATQNVHYSPFLDQNGGGDSGNIHGANIWTGGFTSASRALGVAADDPASTYGSSNANQAGRVHIRFNSGNTSTLGVYSISPLLTVTDAIPEPSAALLGAIGCLFLLRRRR